jgi:hypothetical protein
VSTPLYGPCDSETKEIVDYLRTKFQIPKHVSNFTIRFNKDAVVDIDCNYYPMKSNGN